MRKKIKKVLDKTTVDDKIFSATKRLADKTKVDESIISATKKLASKTDVDEKLFSAAKKVKQEIRKNIGKSVLAAFGFMIALVWRDVVKESVNRLVKMLSLTGDGFIFIIITAFVTTIICVFGILYVSRWTEKG